MATDKQTPQREGEGPESTESWYRWVARAIPALALTAPAIWQLGLLVQAWWGRYFYPYDLEWMEGGMLTHAWRLLHGESIYPAPSIEFVPYLYTPLYSAVVAASSMLTGVTYQIGRAVSILSMVAVFMLASVALRFEFEDEQSSEWVSWVAVFLAVGIMASGYPWTDGWYDIARPDAFLCAVGLGGFVGLRRVLARSVDVGEGWRAFWHPAVAGWGACLALSFFIKQTGVLFVAGAGVTVLFARWRAVPSFVVSAGVVGLGGTWLLNLMTGGWFWRYIFIYHQRHANSWERFLSAWAAMFEQLPVVCVVGAVGFVSASSFWLAGRIGRWTGWGSERLRHASAGRPVTGTLYWGWLALIGTFFGATGFATQWAETNAYMPFIIFGAFAAATVVASLPRMWTVLDPSRRTSLVVATVLMTVISGSLVESTWRPQRFVPADSKRAAGDRLVELMESFDGPIFAPYFPWYVHLAGERPLMHIMSKNDILRLDPARCPVRHGESPWLCPELPERGKHIAGWTGALTKENYSAIILSPQSRVISRLDDFRLYDKLPPSKLPVPPTGYRFGTMAVMRPETPPKLPDDATMVFDFESELDGDWSISGRAWGDGPVSSAVRGQQPVGGYTGDRFMNSYHGADAAEGVATSPAFQITRPRMHLQVGGGRLSNGVRVELRVDGDVVRKAAGEGSEMMREVTWDLSDWVGRQATLRLVDDSSRGWGHLTVGDIWLEGTLNPGSSKNPDSDADQDDDG